MIKIYANGEFVGRLMTQSQLDALLEIIDSNEVDLQYEYEED